MNFFKHHKVNNGFTRTHKYVSGFTLVEVLVACSIITITTFSLLSGAAKGIELSTRGLRQMQASYLLEEGGEAVKTIRDAAWTNISGLTVGTTYYLSYNNGTNVWSLSTTSNTIDSVFTRTVVLSAVNRDGSDDITASGGTTDTRTKKVVITVSWAASGTTVSKTLTLYIADIFT